MIEGLTSTFPPLKTLGSTSRLPEPATALVGRDDELDLLAAQLASPDVRLVTLTGPGGSGKTRLGVALAHRLSTAESGGVYFVALAGDTTVDGAWTTLAEALGLLPEQRTAEVGTRPRSPAARLLIVLDNLEQLVGAEEVAAPAAERLAQRRARRDLAAPVARPWRAPAPGPASCAAP